MVAMPNQTPNLAPGCVGAGCPMCGGAGRVGSEPCTGVVSVPVSVPINGVKDDQSIKKPALIALGVWIGTVLAIASMVFAAAWMVGVAAGIVVASYGWAMEVLGG